MSLSDDSDHDCTKLFEEVQNKLDSTTPWIGLYIAAASVACLLAMVADTLFSGTKFFPCRSKFFSLNAFSLTVLAVAMKLPVDLTITDISFLDQWARISSLIFMCTCMNHFMISLGSMENNEILLNIAALGILVITITANVCIHIVEMPKLGLSYMFQQQIACVAIMLLLLAMSCSIALMLPCIKRYMELKYKEMHKEVSNRQLDDVGVLVKGYWVMAETSDPRFLLARSPISFPLILISISTLILSCQTFLVFLGDLKSNVNKFCRHNPSNYSWSMKWIVGCQFMGVLFGCFVNRFRFSTSWDVPFMEQRSFRDQLKVEKYWTSKLVDWRDTPLPFRVQNRVFKKLLCDVLRFALNFCIVVQILFILACKLVRLLPKSFIKSTISNFSNFEVRGSESSSDMEQYALLLEGESRFPDGMLMIICKDVDSMIQKGEKKQPKNLIRLLRKSASFKGVERFDSNLVPGLHSPEPPNCWSMPVVTLTAISMALINIADDEANQLLDSISEGLSFVKLIEKTQDTNGELESIRKAADLVWVGVEVYGKWDYKDLHSTSVRGATLMETLQNLSNVAENIVIEFMAQTRDVLMQNPLNWPARVIAANSMYRIAQTILVGMANGEHQNDDELFESISITIADILAACLTNLVRVITLKCHGNDFRERHKGVRRAAIVYGESKEILEILQHRELPLLDVDQAGNIDEWRASMAPDTENPLASPTTSSDNAISPLASPSTSSDNALLQHQVTMQQ